MKNVKYISTKIENILFYFLIIFFLISLFSFSFSNIKAVKSGLVLWYNSVLPSLFPFFVATELLLHTNIIHIFEYFFSKITKPIFNVNGKCSFCILMGFICGYPIGAKITSKLYSTGNCSLEEAERLLAFTNNSSPLFIIGSIGVSMFFDYKIGILLLVSHFLSAISVGIFFRYWKNSSITNCSDSILLTEKEEQLNFNNFGKILAESLTSATSSVILIGGFVVFFSLLISMLNSAHFFSIVNSISFPILNGLNLPLKFSNAFITGILEITNGINLISTINIKKISINIIMVSFLLGFGGLSILFQILSIISKYQISIKPYIIGKLIQASLSALYTYLLIINIPFFYFDL